MERKSIGSFISALRKANGMTQKNLAEMLNVSDKAVSRWERDECAPDLSLIPVIAEIFNVTADELLCGERKSSESVKVKTTNTRTEKQKQRLLNSAFEKFRNKSLISLGISAFAIILGIVIELIFKIYPITIAFVVITVVASVICEVTFIHNLWLTVGAEEFDDIKTDSLKVKAINFSKHLFAVNYFVLFTAMLFPFFLSLCSGHECDVYKQFEYYSERILSLDSFLIALVYFAIGLIIFKTIWCFILKKLEKSGVYPIDEATSNLLKFKKIFSIVFTSVLLFTVVLQTVFLYPSDFYSNPTVLKDEESFLEYMSDNGSDIGYAEICGLTVCFGTLDVDCENDYVEQFFDNNDNVIYEYTCKRNDVSMLSYDTENVFPVEVFTLEQVAYSELNYRLVCFGILILEMFIFTTIYNIILKRKKKK